MSTLYLDRRGVSLKLEGRALTIYVDGSHQGSVPLHLLERVVMHSNVALDSGLLARLADAGVAVLAFGGRLGSKQALVLPRAGNDAARRVGQYRRHGDSDWCRSWSARLVRAKLQGQARLLRRALRERPDLRHSLTAGLERLAQARKRVAEDASLSIESLRGIEGAAAAGYFKCLADLFPPSLGFAGRNRRPPRDPANALLSLGYTLAHFDAVRACHAAGLDPLIGFYHALELGRESLASDLIEPLRPRVDAWVWDCLRRQVFRKEDFRDDGEACLLGKAARGRFYGELEPVARSLRRWLRRVTAALVRDLSAAGQEVVG